LNEVTVIFWDEFVSNSRALFEAAVDYFERRGKSFVFVCSGDLRQIPPVVKNGSPEEVINATCTSSDLWSSFTVYKLEENMRLKALRTALPANATQQQRDFINEQKAYAGKTTAMPVLMIRSLMFDIMLLFSNKLRILA
jgi:hypothetical protein